MMKRAVITASWIAAIAAPAVLAAVMKFGCCALPSMPFCHMASASHHEAPAPAPARETVKRFVMPASLVLHATDEAHAFPSIARVTYRSFITLGATRCDRDVGLNVLLATFLI